MKKYFSLFITIIALSLTGCSGNDNPKASDKAISCAKEAIEIAEGYLTYDIDFKEAKNRLDELQEDMEYVSTMSKEEECYYPDFSINSKLISLSIALVSDNYDGNSETYDEIQGIIVDLQEYID